MNERAGGARTRVALVSHGYSEPTLQEQVVAIGRHCDVRLIAPRRSRGLVFERLDVRDTGAGVTRTFRRIGLFGTQYLLGSPTLGFRRFAPDVVHIDYEPWHTIFWQAWLAAKLFAPRAVIVVTAKKNTYRRYAGLAGKAKAWLARRGFSQVDHVIAASEKARSMLTATFDLDASSTSVSTHVGVDTAVFSPRDGERTASASPVVVGYCGRFAAHKGLADLLEVAEELAARGTDLRVRLLGAGPMADDLGAKARESSWLEVLDAVPTAEVAEFLAGLDVYVLPALRLEDHEEHDGHALLQAMACGVAPVVSDSGIIPEIVWTPDLGLRYESGDRDGLRDALGTLVRSAELRRSIGRNVREEARRRYGLDEVASSRAAIYRAVARTQPSRSATPATAA